MNAPKIVSLFSGAGGLDLGFKDAGFDLSFAVDSSPWAIRTHKRNFPKTTSLAADLVQLGPEGVLQRLRTVLRDGETIGVIGGPPCQGFSRANTSASADDPRNLLPLLYLDIIELLQKHFQVVFVLFENVLGIRDSKHEFAFAGILERLTALGLSHRVDEFCALDFGVPQNRRRVIISAFASSEAAQDFVPATQTRRDLSVGSVLRDLPEPAFYARNLDPLLFPVHENHWTMRPMSKRFSNPETEVTGTRSFRRLSWTKPSPTVAYGHREIHVHPDGRRRLSVYEAMLLQGFPQDFVIEGPLSAQVDQVSNAVPPPLARALAVATTRALDSRIDRSSHLKQDA